MKDGLLFKDIFNYIAYNYERQAPLVATSSRIDFEVFCKADLKDNWEDFLEELAGQIKNIYNLTADLEINISNFEYYAHITRRTSSKRTPLWILSGHKF